MTIRALLLALVVAAVASNGSAIASCDAPASGYVPNAEVATRIADAILTEIYGERFIAKEKPFSVTLLGDVWTVTGKDEPPSKDPGSVSFGGVAEIRISKSDGRILYVCHGE